MRASLGCLFTLLCGLLGGGVGICLSLYLSNGNSLTVGFLAILLLPIGFFSGVGIGLPIKNRIETHLESTQGPKTKIFILFGIALTFASLFAEILFYVAHSDDPPSDKAMIAHFEKHRQTFDRLVEMAQHDHGLKRVDDNWTEPENPESIGVSKERISKYRQLFEQARVSRGFSAYSRQQGQIDFLYWGRGSAISSDYSKKFSYCPTTPKPILPSLDRSSRQNGYRRIVGNWYLHVEYIPG
jgi:hypothetical protein